MKCPKCHFENTPDSKFCKRCGTELSPVSMTKTLKASINLPSQTILGKYEILGELGRGGMGVVYKAEDTRLKRTVALKFLPAELTKNQEAKDRFSQEAQAAAALEHPNICTVYEVDEAEGQTFIAMSYVEGQSLKDKLKEGPIASDEAANITLQVAKGLKEAHEKGIIHRDIKPANIMITEKGQAKITDFGLAKLSWGTDLTKSPTIMGTVAYMSPEQARGEEVDHRTDIWSLGVILYEMLVGERPFQKSHEQALIFSIVNEKPRPISSLRTNIPSHLERIVEKALSKTPNSRYQSMQDLIQDLGQPQKATLSKAKRSIAVLPFTNMSGDPEQEYFCDGITEELINSLTQIKDLRVIARTSSFMFKGKQEDIREIGAKLNVETLLEGSVRKSGNRLRITAQLIDVSDGSHLWSDRYDREMEDIFTIQDEISLAIVDKLKIELLGTEKAGLVKRYTENVEAYNFYLKGRYFCRNQRTHEGLNKSLEFYQKAIREDPEFALAYTGSTITYVYIGWMNYVAPRIAYQKAKEQALKALELDDMIGESHSAMAWVMDLYDWDWVGAKKEFERAIAINSSDAETYHKYSHLLAEMGHFDESIEAMERALELEPLAIDIHACAGMNLYLARRYDEAIEQLNKTIELNPNFYDPYGWLGIVYVQKGKYQQAIEIFQKAEAFPEIRTRMIATQAYTQAVTGQKGEAQKKLKQLIELSEKEPVEPYFIAWIYAGLGENNGAINFLHKACEARSGFQRMVVKADPWLDNLRSDPRFTALLKKMGLD